MSTISKRRQTFNSPGDLHELTWSCLGRRPLLKSDRAKNWLAEAIETHKRAFHFDLNAFVFMPEHVHLLIRPRLENYDVTRVRAAIKRSVTKKAVTFLKEKHPAKLATLQISPGVYRFWQDGPGFDRNLHTDEAIRASINYMHANPVSRRLCDSIDGYKWSSARAYYGLTSVLPVDVWQPFGP
jgi:putative transposase